MRLLQELGVPTADLHSLLCSRIEAVNTHVNHAARVSEREQPEQGAAKPPTNRPLVQVAPPLQRRVSRKFSIARFFSFTQTQTAEQSNDLTSHSQCSADAIGTAVPSIGGVLRDITELNGGISAEIDFRVRWNDLMILQVP
jgi:hypothetical protein